MEASDKKSTRGRPKLYSPGTKKQRRKALDANKWKVNIGKHETRWQRLKDESGVKTHEEFAGLLLDSYSRVKADEPGTSVLVPPVRKTLNVPVQSTPVAAPRVHLKIQSDLSGISGSESNEKVCHQARSHAEARKHGLQHHRGLNRRKAEFDACEQQRMSDLSGVEALQNEPEVPSTSQGILGSEKLQSSTEHTASLMVTHEPPNRRSLRNLSKETTSQNMKSSFMNPFNLTLYTSEDQYGGEDLDSDAEYEPSFNLSIGPMRHNVESDVELDELVFALGEDEEQDFDDTDTEELGIGILKVASLDDIPILTEDTVHLVYLRPLLDLASIKIDSVCKVQSCCGAVSVKTHCIGSAIYIKWECENGHEVHKWSSQPVLKRGLHGGDIMISAATLFSGNNFSKIRLFAKFLNLRLLSPSTFTLIQRSYLVPSVDEMWAEKQAGVVSEFEGKQMVVLGDGRMDSPGHCAQYCTYTMMEETTKKIVSCLTLDKRVAGGKSTNLEKLGFVKSMQALAAKNLNIREVVTDAHMQVTSIMKKDFKEVKHSYDLWHVAKNLGKKITKASQDKTCRALAGWTKHIVNHFWYCAQTASSYDQFIGIWFGLIHHVVNEHEWILAYGSDASNHCSHGPLEEEGREVQWLKKDSKPHKALIEIIGNKRFLNNIPYYLNARSTSELETFQNHILMYAAKRFSFTPPVYRARNLLAALDYNEHIDRPNKVNKDGTQRYQRLFNKKSQRYTAFALKVPKEFPHIPELMEKVVRRRVLDRIGMKRKMVLEDDDPRRIARTLAPAPPPTSVIVKEKKSRLSKD